MCLNKVISFFYRVYSYGMFMESPVDKDRQCCVYFICL
jgi:hypothetical protein